MLDQSFIIARERLLSPFSLTDNQLTTVLDYLLHGKTESADLYFQDIHHESWGIENGIIKQGQFYIDQGVGVRTIHQTKVGFAYSQALHFKALMQTAQAARSIATQKNSLIQSPSIHIPSQHQNLYSTINPLISIKDEDKLSLLTPLDRLARQMSGMVTQVNANLQAQYETILLLCDDGQLMTDVRPMVKMYVSIIVERHGRQEVGYASEALRSDYTRFIKNNIATRLVEEAVQQAVFNLDAKAAPAGTMPVVLGPGEPGVLIHEAVGHGLEGDFNRKGTSAFSGKIGQSVASNLCTIVDNGTLPEHCGSLNMDDEGIPTQNTVLIKEGILKQYMQDKSNAKLMHTQSTGNGRRQSYRYLPMPRMTNTYMLPGEDNPEDIIASVKRGLYAADFSGGEVDITSGKFVFSASSAFLIENGKITHPVKGATLVGDGPEVLKYISAVGNDLKIARGGGLCGKEGQMVPVSVGQPTLKIDALTVGGTT